MSQGSAPATVAVLILLPLLAWRIYARIRRVVGRQKLSRKRAWLTLVIFPVLLALLAYASHANGEHLAALAAGLAAGCLLAVFGLRLTRFEATADGIFYTPSAYLGIGVALLLVGRVLYRLVEVFRLDTRTLPGTTELMPGPLTLVIVGLLAGYYMGYALGLVLWRTPRLSPCLSSDDQA